ncbi:type I secretion system permease/ATPase [uncultured Roseobacter sp.]|uniref:type I secretion system permease/ATPase n=1 Tax=uncultured Roseobacter sp. TaxID=114847 RepID=UPI0026113C07|nr:type I secretion system permease/ATPase [uncultured Roseobacter sp.]
MTPPAYGLPELKRARHASRWLLISAFLFSIFVNLLMLTGPLFMLQVYDRVLASGSEETLVALFSLVAALYLFLGFLDFARARLLTRFSARFQALLDRRVFDAALKQSQSSPNGLPANAGLRDLAMVQNALGSPVVLAVLDAPWSPLFVAVIFVFHPLLGWIALAGVAVLVALTVINSFWTGTRASQAQKSLHKAQRYADKSCEQSGLIQALGMHDASAAQWHKMRDTALEQSIRSTDRVGLVTAFTKAFRLFLQSAILAAGAYLVLRGDLTGGAMIASSILLGRALMPIEKLLGQWPFLQRARAAWTSLALLLSKTPPEPQKTRLPRPCAEVSLSNVTVFAPGVQQPILQGVSFTVGPGQVLGVVGRSGAGKSTLAHTLLGLRHPSAGEVRVGGAKIDQYGADQFGSYVGYLPQDVTLFDGTIAQNIARMAQDPSDEMIVEAAKRANAHDFILSLPNGYDTAVAEQGTQLSGGQKQRVALARALYGDPLLLVLDEPNSALDAEGALALNQAIRGFRESDKAVIIMTHRAAALTECDRLIILDQGRVAATGPRDKVIKGMLNRTKDTPQVVTMAASQ